MLVKIFASLGLLLCLALALHMCLSRRQQLRLEAWWVKISTWVVTRTLRSFNARERRRAAHEAALEAISRARRGSQEGSGVEGKWEGNVYRPKQFEEPRKPH
jgi:hypothetical protein